MGINATLSNPSSVTGTTTTPAAVSASTQSGTPVPQITRMAVEGIRGADGDMTWAGEWSSSTNYVANQVVYYEGSAYVCIQGNSNLRPDLNTTQWTLMVQKGDTGATGATGPAGASGAKGAVGDVLLVPQEQLDLLVLKDHKDHKDHKEMQGVLPQSQLVLLLLVLWGQMHLFPIQEQVNKQF